MYARVPWKVFGGRSWKIGGGFLEGAWEAFGRFFAGLVAALGMLSTGMCEIQGKDPRKLRNLVDVPLALRVFFFC